jgi:hypothetical protein
MDCAINDAGIAHNALPIAIVIQHDTAATVVDTPRARAASAKRPQPSKNAQYGVSQIKIAEAPTEKIQGSRHMTVSAFEAPRKNRTPTTDKPRA